MGRTTQTNHWQWQLLNAILAIRTRTIPVEKTGDRDDVAPPHVRGPEKCLPNQRLAFGSMYSENQYWPPGNAEHELSRPRLG